MEEMHDVIIGMDALDAIRAEIQSRQAKRRELEAEIEGLRVAEMIIIGAKGYSVAFEK